MKFFIVIIFILIVTTSHAFDKYLPWDVSDISGTGEITAYDLALSLRGYDNEQKIIMENQTPIKAFIPEIKSAPDSTKIVPIIVSDTTGLGIISIDIRLKYNPEILTAIDVITNNTLTFGWEIYYGIKNDYIQIGIINSDISVTLAGKGTLINIVFKVSSSARPGQSSSLELTRLYFNENRIPVDITNGVFYIVDLIQQKIHLYRGWNLISIMVEPLDSDILSVLSSIRDHCISVWSYDKSWKYYIFGVKNPGSLSNIEPGKGYWVNVDSEIDLIINGNELNNSAIILTSGWNLVGYNYHSAITTPDALSSISEYYQSVWGYENQNGWSKFIKGASNETNNLNELRPGFGYWINVTEDCIMNIEP